MPDDYRRRIMVAVGWTALHKWSVRLGMLAVFIVLGRLLGPADIGLAALALAIIGLLTLIADVGTNVFIVQTPHLDRRQVSTVFWTQLALCCALALGLVLAAQPLAVLLQQPRLEGVLHVLALGLPLSGMAGTPAALLTRDLLMKPLALREIIAAGAGSVVGLGTAVSGAGVWALVAQSLCQSVVGVIVLWRATTWRPTATFSLATARSVVRFGSAVSGTNLLSALHDRLEQFLLGALAGVELLGYWAIGTRLLNLLHDVTMAVLDTVAFPVLAKERRDEVRFKRAFGNATAVGLALLAPILTMLAFATPFVIEFLFGARWSAAITPMQILCLAYTLGGLIWFSRPAFFAHGRPGVEFTITLVHLLLHGAAVVLAAPHGLVVLAWAVAADVVVMVSVRVWLQRLVMHVTWRVYGSSLRVLAAAAGMAAVMALVEVVGDESRVLVTAGELVAGVLTYMVLLRLFNRKLSDEIVGDLRRLVRQ